MDNAGSEHTSQVILSTTEHSDDVDNASHEQATTPLSMVTDDRMDEHTSPVLPTTTAATGHSDDDLGATTPSVSGDDAINCATDQQFQATREVPSTSGTNGDLPVVVTVPQQLVLRAPMRRPAGRPVATRQRLFDAKVKPFEKMSAVQKDKFVCPGSVQMLLSKVFVGGQKYACPICMPYCRSV